MAKNPRCQGKRRYWRGQTLGNYKCGRVARYTFQTYVGLTRNHFACGEEECMRSIHNGYGYHNVQELTA